MRRLMIGLIAALPIALGLPVAAGAHHKGLPHVDCRSVAAAGPLSAPSPAEVGTYDPFGVDEAGNRYACA
jgi:hypothetical protein